MPDVNDRCRSCGAPIIWATTGEGKAMPVDPSPSAGGNLILIPQHGKTAPLCMVVDQTMIELPGFEQSHHFPHWASCPHADEWRHRYTGRADKRGNR